LGLFINLKIATALGLTVPAKEHRRTTRLLMNVELAMADIRRDRPVLTDMEASGLIKIAGFLRQMIRVLHRIR
jgi:hypothetical protein